MAKSDSKSLFTLRSSHPFSLASIAGAAFGFALIIVAILVGTSNFMAFLSIEGFMIVIGGTLAVAFMSYQASDVMEALRGVGLMFKKANVTHENLYRDLINIIAWARIMKEKGLRGLENQVDDEGINDPFVRYGLDMVVSNYTGEEVRGMMETAAEAFYERDTIPANILLAMASHAPAFGMVGTLIGMVIMLGNFSGDMSGIGHGLAVALLATLYGVVTARMLYLPAATKIMQKQDNLRFRNHLITEGMAMLVANKSPRYIQDKLNSFLKPGLHSRVTLPEPTPTTPPPAGATATAASGLSATKNV
ncbi:MAG TPA: MotA/TolQ/ExbB proton channel family protein [Alphaproteobacteria bacterium]|nr:MotA/TolQ/ExbB proton channel family protein [Micavibrio sp.]HQX26416.1 MotA/TolQ/ExbB proton channel family protein [Alphaproteobacteria bacterium]